MNTLELNKMGLAPMTEFEMQEVEGGNILKAVGNAIASAATAVAGAVVDAAEWLFDNGAKVGAAIGAGVAAITLYDKIKAE
jgi:hypothetical protein